MNAWTAISVMFCTVIVSGLIAWWIYEDYQYSSLPWEKGYTQTTLPGAFGANWVKNESH